MVEIFRKVLPKDPVRPRAPIDEPAQVTVVEDALREAHRLNAELNPTLAVAMYQRALALDPSCSIAATELGATLVDAGRAEEGLAFFAAHLASFPAASEVRLAYAGSLLRTGALEGAVEECRRCLEQRPDWDAPYPPLIRALHRLGRGLAARSALEELEPLTQDHRIVAMLETMLEKAK